MKALRHGQRYTGFLVLFSYFFVNIGMQAANISSIVYFPISYLGFVTQGCFYSGCVIGTVCSNPAIAAFSIVKTLAFSILLSGLFPIIFPISQAFENLELFIIVLVSSLFSGIGFGFYSIVQARPILVLQQLQKRSVCIGITQGLIGVSGVFAGAIMCLPSLWPIAPENWQIAVCAGVLTFVSIVANLMTTEENLLIKPNKATTLHYLRFVFSYLAIGVKNYVDWKNAVFWTLAFFFIRTSGLRLFCTWVLLVWTMFRVFHRGCSLRTFYWPSD